MATKVRSSNSFRGAEQQPVEDPLRAFSSEELRRALIDLLVDGVVSPSILAREIDTIRTSSHSKLITVENPDDLEKKIDKLKLYEDLRKQCGKMKDTLDKFVVSTNGIPTWEQIRPAVTAEVLDKAKKMAQPVLLLVPPTTRASKYKAIHRYQAHPGSTDKLTEDNDWNGGKKAQTKKWRSLIVEGASDVPEHEYINGYLHRSHHLTSNYQIISALVEAYEKEGLQVITDASTYLTLAMRAIADGRPLDNGKSTILNSNVLETCGSSDNKPDIAATWSCPHITFGHVDKYRLDPHGLRLRSLIDLNVG